MSFLGQGKPLFPSAVRHQEIRVPNSEDIHHDHHHEDHLTLPSSSNTSKLDWLQNKSFKTEDAIAIAKFHNRREAEFYEDYERSESNEESLGEHGKGHHDSADNDEQMTTHKRKKHSGHKHKKHSKYSSDSEIEHKRKHKKHSSRYSSDSEDSQRRSHHDHMHSKKKSKHRKHKHRSKDRSRRKAASNSDEGKGDGTEVGSANPTWLDDVRHNTTEMFYVDKKCDKNNLCFDSLHFTDTAFYKRIGKACLGLTGTKRQLFNTTSKKSSRSDLRYFGKGKLKVTDEVEIVLPNKENSSIPMQSFISLGKDSSTQSPSEVDPLGVLDASTRQYLGDQTSGQDPVKKSQNQTENEVKPSSHVNPVAEFNRYLHENPHDINKWLEFVRFQDTSEGIQALTVDGAAESERKKKHKVYISEMKQAIMEKALKKNPNNLQLQLAQLELNRELWTDSQQVEEWEKVLKCHSDNIDLWKEYILFNQCAFSVFTLSKATSLYERFFETQLSEDHGQVSEDGSSLTTHFMDLFIQQCHLWRQAGHTEKAVAAFQAMVELNCFCPEKLTQNTPIKGRIAFLETFWDSGEPRFGEKNAKGWNAWMTKKEKGGWQEMSTQNAGDEEDDTSKPLESSKPVWQAWLQEETHREQTHLLPWRPDESKGETEEDCEDPERTVLFDDISGILFKVQTQSEKFYLICQFLEFLGVNTSFNSSSTVKKSSYLALEHPEQLSIKITSSGIWQQHGDHDDITGWQHRGNGVAFNCESLATRTRIFCKELKDLITNIFTQSLALFDEPARTDLLVLWLRHELGVVQKVQTKQEKKRAKSARKFGKNMLSKEENRNNLMLWEVFAKWEWSLGNKKDACKMLDMGLSFGKQLKDGNRKRNVAQVVSTYTDLLCNQESTAAALHILTNYADGTPYVPFNSANPTVPSVAIIRARKAYQEMLDCVMKGDRCTQDWLQQSGSCIVHIAKCYARFQYLTVGMQAASVVMETSLSYLKRSSDVDRNLHIQQKLDSELVLTSYCKLLAQHVFNNPSPLNVLRNLLRRALVEFPNNQVFLQLFITVEAKSHIAGRARRYFDQATKEAQTPVPWLCAISAEKQRQQMINSKTDILGASSSLPETGISNRIRSLFDRAASHKASRHCILLWRLYMQFEVHQGNTKRAQAIFYQALQHCPWAKVLYVDAVRLFPEKIQDFHDLLMEKELRIRAPIEEIELLLNG